MDASEYIDLEKHYGAHLENPLPVVLSRGEGPWVWDVEGNKYLDMLAGYSALNFGHRHPAIIKALLEQVDKATLTSNAFLHDQIGPFLQDLSNLTGLPRVMALNSGAEAVETSIKAARKWGYSRKHVADGTAEILVCENNFHGRTTSIVSFSTEPRYRNGFGPLTPGFRAIKYGDAKALEAAIGPSTVAFLAEPIQGEGGIILPPSGWLTDVATICRKQNVLFMLDEIQTGFGRTGQPFCFQHEGATPDVLIMGKALGGGVLPVSAIAATNDLMDVFTPGSHGSTFGANPLACAVGRAAIRALREEHLAERAAELGAYFIGRLRTIVSPHILEVRGKGLLIGIEVRASAGPARPFCEKLMKQGILAKETHGQVIRFSPPLVVTKDDLDWAFSRIEAVLA
jgi:ornithine--oxo-acid transaminase